MTNEKITLNDIYVVCNRLEDKLDKRMCVAEDRIDRLEDFRSKWIGIVSVVSISASAVFAWLWDRVVRQ